MATHSSTLAWKIPWAEQPGRLQSMGSQRVGHDWATSFSIFTFMHWRRKWQPTPVFLPGESQGPGSLVGCHLWGCTESDTTEATQQEEKVKSLSRVQLLVTPWTACSLPGSSIHGIFQVRVLEWGAMAFSDFMYSSVYMSVPIFQFNTPALSPGNCKFVFYICDSTSVL